MLIKMPMFGKWQWSTAFDPLSVLEIRLVSYFLEPLQFEMETRVMVFQVSII